MKKKVTAEEFLAQLNSDPEHRKNRAEAEQMRAKRAADLSRAEAPLIEELQLVGVDVRSAWDLINRSGGQRKVLRILLHHLQRPYPAPVREGIARALAVPEAKFAWDRLKQLYENEREARPKDGLAFALAAIANDERIEDVIRLARDVRNGSSRILLLEVDDEQKLGFRVTYQGQAMPLNIIVFKDDVEAPDLYFFAQPNLIQEIDNLMIAFSEQNGIQR